MIQVKKMKSPYPDKRELVAEKKIHLTDSQHCDRSSQSSLVYVRVHFLGQDHNHSPITKSSHLLLYYIPSSRFYYIRTPFLHELKCFFYGVKAGKMTNILTSILLFNRLSFILAFFTHLFSRSAFFTVYTIKLPNKVLKFINYFHTRS